MSCDFTSQLKATAAFGEGLILHFVLKIIQMNFHLSLSRSHAHFKQFHVDIANNIRIPTGGIVLQLVWGWCVSIIQEFQL